MMIKTKHDLPEKTRKLIVDLLNERLADSLDLMLQARQAHWNVRGPAFIPLHELFDEIAGELNGYADRLAERALQLGGLAEGTIQAVASRSKLEAYPLDLTRGEGHVERLSSQIAAVARLTREAIDTADEAGDQGTADLFTEVTLGLDELRWKVEAHQHVD